MDVERGVLKLERCVKAKRFLEQKLKSNPEDEAIMQAIESNTRSIAYIKKELNFDDRFDVVKKGCCTTKCKPLPKKGDLTDEGEVEGVFVKIRLLKKDGTIGGQTKYVEVNE